MVEIKRAQDFSVNSGAVMEDALLTICCDGVVLSILIDGWNLSVKGNDEILVKDFRSFTTV